MGTHYDYDYQFKKRLSERPIYNTKVKLYPDGTLNFVYSDKPIFNQSLLNTGKKSDSFYDGLQFSNCFYRLKRESEIIGYKHDKIMYDIEVYYKSVDNYLLFMQESRRYDKQLIHDSLVLNGFDFDLSKAIRNSIRTDNLKRIREDVFDLVLSNSWDYFFTGTIDPKKLDSSDPEVLKKPLQKWLNNMRERYGLSYIIIFERHKNSDGIHIHGLIKSAVPLRLVDSGTKSYYGFKKPMRDSTALKHGLDISKGHTVYNLSTWRFGWSTAIEVYGSQGALSNYISKYITKDNDKIMGRYYWHSRDLIKPQITYFNSDFSKLPFAQYHGFKYNYVPSDDLATTNYHYDDDFIVFELDE